MVVRFTTSCVISAYHHLSCEFKSPSWRVVFDTTLCDKVSQYLVEGRWFSPGTPVASTNTTDHHNIVQILEKVALRTNIPNPFRQCNQQTFEHLIYFYNTGEQSNMYIPHIRMDIVL